MIIQQQISISTRGRSTTNITAQLQAFVADSGIRSGLCHAFIHHTSASLIITENADPDVRRDLEYYLSKLVQDGDAGFLHVLEGEDDMSAHIRTVLTQTEITIPIINGRCGLGTWQGLFLWEHRSHPHTRKITLTAQGE